MRLRYKHYWHHAIVIVRLRLGFMTASSDLSGPFLLSYLVFVFISFLIFFCFWAVRWIKLAISSAFERTLIYRIVSYRVVSYSLQATLMAAEGISEGVAVGAVTGFVIAAVVHVGVIYCACTYANHSRTVAAKYNNLPTPLLNCISRRRSLFLSQCNRRRSFDK